MLRKKPRNARLLAYTGVLLLVSCNSNSDSFIPPSEFSKEYLSFSPSNLHNLKELNSWIVTDKESPISLIQYNLNSDEVTAVSEKSGCITIFDVVLGEAISRKLLNVDNFRAIGLDEQGRKLLGGTSILKHDDETEHLDLIAIWNASSGNLDTCISGGCFIEGPSDLTSADIGASMDPNAETIIVFDEYAYSVVGLSDNLVSGVTLVNHPDSDYWWHIGAIAMDSDNNRLAIVFQEGRIQLEKISKQNNWFLTGAEILDEGRENELELIRLAVFHRTGKWLAVATGKELSIWDLRSSVEKKLFHNQMQNITAMKFSPSDDLLFIATNDQIQIIELKEKAVLSKIKAPGITSLDVSADNRLLLWGDKHGIVHAWGIP